MFPAASQVISDQTELRLLEQSPRRTEDLMHTWGCRNGTVGELLKILEGLQLFRARDIILKCTYTFYIIVSSHLRVSVASTTSDALTSKVIRWVLWLSWNSHDSLDLGTLLTSNTFKLWRNTMLSDVTVFCCDHTCLFVLVSVLWSLDRLLALQLQPITSSPDIYWKKTTVNN